MLGLDGSQSAFRPQTLSQAKSADLLTNWRLTPATMMAYLDPTWIPAKWLQYLSFKIAQCVVRGNCGLLISAPPRHGKSLLSTIATPLWTLENFPSKNVVVATYGEELSTDFSRHIRDLIRNNQDVLSVRLRQDTQRVTNFLTTEGGGLKAVGLRGAITGRGADVFVLDDYIKEPKEAMSAAYLEDLWTWYLTVARTRLEPGAVVIILATRWVANDLHGRIMKRQRETGRKFFEYVELPALAHANEVDPIGRAPGEVLFAERYSQEAILDIKIELGTRWFGAMFQQRPEEDENKVLDSAWFKPMEPEEFEARLQAMSTHPHEKHALQWVRSWDMASTKEAGDYTTGAKALYNKVTKEFFIVDMRRGQWSPAKVELEFSKAIAEDDNDCERYGGVKVGMEQEPGSSGAYSIRHFEKIARSVVAGTNLYEQRATTSKLLNAQPLIAAAEDGKVWVVCARDDHGVARGWAKALYEELDTFPEGAHDDQVDALSNAYKLATGKLSLSAAFGRKNLQKPASNGQNGVQTAQNMPKTRSLSTFGRK